MDTAFHQFMKGLIDYAGLFPPARLSLESAIRAYVRDRNSAHGWVLGRFVIPAGRLEELKPLRRELFPAAGRPNTFTALLGESVDDDIRKILAFHDHHGDAVRVEALESKLATGQSVRDETLQYLKKVEAVIGAAGLNGLDLFVEPPDLSGPVVDGTVRALSEFGNQPGLGRAGFKLRCGGVSPSAFPEPAVVANVLHRCRENGIPVKFTAGLHHPVRHLDRELGCKAHGFFNVFGAGILAYTVSMDRDRLEACLREEKPARFRFGNDRFAWHNTSVGSVGVQMARKAFVTGFGSCSFDEPVDELIKLGLLEKGT